MTKIIESFKRKNWLIPGLLIILFMIGVFLRTWNLQHSYVVTYDTGRDLLKVAEMSKGDITLIGPLLGGHTGVYLGPLTYYYSLPLFILTHGHPVGIVAAHAVVSALLIPLFYFLLRTLHTPRLASLLLTSWLTFLPGSIDQARVLWNPSLLPLLLIPFILCLLWSKKYPVLLTVAGGLWGLLWQTQAYAFLLAPFLLVWLLHSWWQVYTQPVTAASLSRNQYQLILGTAAVAALLTFVPQIVFELKHSFSMLKNALETFQDSSARVAWQTVIQTRPKVLLQALNTTFGGSGLQLYGFAWLGVSIAGLALLASSNFKAQWLLLIISFPLIFFMFYTGAHGHFFDYYLETHYLWILIGVGYILGHLPMHRYVRHGLVLGVGALAVLSFWQYASILSNPNLFDYTWSKQLQSWEYLYTQKTANIPTVEVFTPNLRPTQYQYLNQWYAQKTSQPKAEFNQNLSGNKEVFLLYEQPFVGGSLLAFQDWYQRQQLSGSCTKLQTFGLITVEKCSLP